MKSGTDLNRRNKLGQTCLHIALRRLNRRIARLLLDSGADPSVRDVVGCTPSYYARQNAMWDILEILPPPISMKPGEVMEHHVFVRTVLGIKDKKEAKKVSKPGKKKGKK